MRFSPFLLFVTATLLTTTTAYEWGINGTARTNLKENNVFINVTVINEGSSGFCELNDFPVGKFPLKDYNVPCQDSGYSLSLTWPTFDSKLLATLGTPGNGLYQYDAQIYNREKIVPYNEGCKFGFINGQNGEVVFSGNQQAASLDQRDVEATSISPFTNTLFVSIFILQIKNINFISIQVFNGNSNICTVSNLGYGSLATINARPTACIQFGQDGNSYKDGNQLAFETDKQGVLINIKLWNAWNRAGNQFSVSKTLEVSSNQQFRSYAVEYDSSAENTKRFFRA